MQWSASEPVWSERNVQIEFKLKTFNDQLENCARALIAVYESCNYFLALIARVFSFDREKEAVTKLVGILLIFFLYIASCKSFQKLLIKNSDRTEVNRSPHLSF